MVMGVNIASRIESLGQAGTIMFSEDVFQKIRNNNQFKSQRLGSFDFKNVDQPMQIYALANKGIPVPKAASISGKLKTASSKQEPKSAKDHKNAKDEISVAPEAKALEKSIAVLPFVNMSSDPEQDFLLRRDIRRNNQYYCPVTSS